jgi:hypothetical protein
MLSQGMGWLKARFPIHGNGVWSGGSGFLEQLSFVPCLAGSTANQLNI